MRFKWDFLFVARVHKNPKFITVESNVSLSKRNIEEKSTKIMYVWVCERFCCMISDICVLFWPFS